MSLENSLCSGWVEGWVQAKNNAFFGLSAKSLSVGPSVVIRHVGFSFSCSFCDYKSSTKANLKVHTDAKHLGIRYSCDKCDYKGSQAGSLKIHKQNIHDNNL